MNAKPTQQIMGILPEERLTPYVKPFYFTGMDYFGPLSVRVGRRYEKRYGVIFSCLATRAVHLELAEKLNTDSAIMAIRRLIGLRGEINTILSDNGKNLVGASNELKMLVQQLDNSDLNNKLVTRGIKWKFIPPASPNMGGSWERMIHSVKRARRAVLSNQVLRH
ncbi:unnamed protein product [Allacma fusca]|uniref:Integrase catalytic domain-containing protein n=1 Tax=Allacma fusca TaxID=39272 RepID=A0A8J2P0A0_9HEXA|nr:unnamed protein product [Allacma fusca]